MIRNNYDFPFQGEHFKETRIINKFSRGPNLRTAASVEDSRGPPLVGRRDAAGCRGARQDP